jgi:mannose-6-phosphate isomerase-like protein (cupin superfamily)
MSKAFDLASAYVHLRPDDSASVLKVGPRFWATIDRRTDLDDGRLMGTTPQKKDWPHWERHPAGDEILTLMSGEMVMVLETLRGTRRVPLKAGQTFVVPKGLWHRAEVRKKGVLMFITPGAGTEHRPVSP